MTAPLPIRMDLGHGGLDNAPRIVGPVTTATTAKRGDYVLADTSGGAFSVTLPASDRLGVVDIKLHAGTSLTILPAGTDTIDGAANLVLGTTGEIVRLVADGAGEWLKLAGSFALDGGLKNVFVQTTEDVVTVAASGASYTVPDPGLYGWVDITLTANCTFTLPTAPRGKILRFAIRQDGTGGWNVTWPGTVVYLNGGPVEITREPGSVDYVEVVSVRNAAWGLVQHTRLSRWVNTVAASGAAQTIPDPSLYEYNDLTLSAASCALTFPATSLGKTLKMVIRQDATGSRAVTWPTGSIFPGGTDIVISTAANAVDYVKAFSVVEDVWMITRVGAAYAV